MNDLISTQAAIDAVSKACQEWRGIFGRCKDGLLALPSIRELPSAEPERKIGKWLKVSPAGIYECSECGQAVMTNDIEAYKYCHGCGLKMKVS